MAATTRKRDYRLDLPRFMCGHPRTPENTTAQECRTCHRNRQARYRAERRTGRRVIPRDGGVADELRLLLVPERRTRERRPIVIAPSVLAVIEASRAEYEAAIASRRPVSRDSTDTAQGALAI
jgi:hypothetical protein